MSGQERKETVNAISFIWAAAKKKKRRSIWPPIKSESSGRFQESIRLLVFGLTIHDVIRLASYPSSFPWARRLQELHHAVRREIYYWSSRLTA